MAPEPPKRPIARACSRGSGKRWTRRFIAEGIVSAAAVFWAVRKRKRGKLGREQPTYAGKGSEDEHDDLCAHKADTYAECAEGKDSENELTFWVGDNE